MKKLLLVGVAAIFSHLTFAQDFSTYCSERDFASSNLERYGRSEKSLDSMKIVGGKLVAYKKDTTGEAQITFTIPEFWQNSASLASPNVRFKITTSYASVVRIKMVTDGFSKTYDNPFNANKSLVANQEIIYELNVDTAAANINKFQQLIIVVNNNAATAGTITISEFNYGGVACGTLAVVPTATNNATSQLVSATFSPNPVQDVLNVKAVLKNNAQVRLDMISTLGAVVYSNTANNSLELNQTINVANFSKGAYRLVMYVNDVPAKSELVVVQ